MQSLELAWFRRKMELIGAADLWTPEHGLIANNFLHSELSGRLFAHSDTGGHLHLTSTFPSEWDRVLVMVRDTNKKVDDENIHELVQCEIVKSSPGECMLRLLQTLYLPVMMDDGTGQGNTTKDFIEELDRFMASLTESLSWTKGQTLLYVPLVQLGGDLARQTKDRYLIQRLESIVLRWTRQIKEVVRGQDRIIDMEASGPLEEVAFWRQRSFDLEGIRKQLINPEIVSIMKFLEQIKSPYLQPFRSLSNRIDHEACVAAENLKFLTVLEDPCRELGTAKLCDIPMILPVLLQRIRMIWRISPFYNTSEKIAGLLCKVSNEIIHRCSTGIPLIEIFQGDVEKCKSALEESIQACESWKHLYAAMMEFFMVHSLGTLEETGGIQQSQVADLGRKSIFAPVESFLQRCQDILEVCDSQIQFSKKSELPVFGGTRGSEISKSFVEMQETFQKLVSVLKSLPYSLLDVKVTRWHDDYNHFKNGVKDLEVMMQNIMTMAFRHAASLCESIELLEAFKLMARRHPICVCVEHMGHQVCSSFSNELIVIKKQFDQLRRRPLMDYSYPRYSGGALWALQFQRRLKAPMMLLMRAAPYLLETTEGSEISTQYNQMIYSIEQFIQNQHTEWMNSIDPYAMKKLEKSLLDDGGNGFYFLKFDQSFLGLFYEVRYWRRLNLEIPEMASDILEGQNELRVLRANTLIVIRDCNKILAEVDTEERGLVADRINHLTNSISPGLDKVEGSIEAALRATVTRSLQELSNAVNADSKTASSMFNTITVLEKASSSVKLVPSIQELLEVIQTVSRGLITIISVVPRLREQRFTGQGPESTTQQPFTKSTLSPSYGYLPSFYEAIVMDQEEVLMMITAGVLSVTDRVQQYLQYWEKKYKNVWDQDKDAYIRRYERAKKPLSAFESDITKYQDLQEDVQAEETITSIRFLRIDCGPLKNSIIGHCEGWANKFTTLLNAIAKVELEDIYAYMYRNTKDLKQPPETLDMLTEKVNHWHAVREESSTFKTRFEPLQEKYKTLQKFEVPITEDEKTMLERLPLEWEAFESMLESLEEELEQAKKGFYETLSLLVKSFSKEVSDARLSFTERVPTTSSTTTEDSMAFIEEAYNKVDSFQQRSQSLWAGMSIFGMEKLSNKENLATLKDLELLKSMWTLKKEWEEAFDSWKDGLFSELDTAFMESSASVFSKRVFKIGRETKGWGVWNDLKDTIDAFKSTLPLTVDLRNPAMRARHWKQLMEQVGQTFDPTSKDFTLAKVAELRLDLHAAAISELSIAASKELAIEDALLKIKDVWSTLDLDIVPYREVPKIYKLRSTEDFFALLEEHRVTLSSMKSNRAHVHFAKDINKWEHDLSQVSDMIEVVMQVQRQWSYLENIFGGSEDIRKQLPGETTLFNQVNDKFVTTMSKLQEARNALKALCVDGLMESLNNMGQKLEKIQKSLDDYLEQKRQQFPRFYFLSSDDLLDILGQAKDPRNVQPHLKKCFEGIKKLEIHAPGEEGRRQYETTGVFSPDGEYLPFATPVVLDTPPEEWLNRVEAAMYAAVKVHLVKALEDSKLAKKDKWVKDNAGQCVISAGQIKWTADCEKALTGTETSKASLRKLLKKWISYLNKLTDMTRSRISKIDRNKVTALITIEVHARDVIEKLMRVSCTSSNDFEWASQLRFYWEKNDCVIKQVLSIFSYGYEYQGNNGRLVITPLTDRCYITLGAALFTRRGGNPLGPAGTGKTETVKDLGKALARYVIVFNCSDGVDYKMTATMFSGIAQTGAWICLDEFNRIEVEVLSVVATQIASIMAAIKAGLSCFIFQGAEIRLIPTCGIFVTMNPGYAGRSELPENLKAMLRPVSMMVPDFTLIAENMLFSEGFRSAKVLAKKLIAIMELSQRQLSKQDHYDYGLRSFVIPIARAAGATKRADPEMVEELILMGAMRDLIMPKLIYADIPLFNALLSDLFPGVELPQKESDVLRKAVEQELVAMGLQVINDFVTKILQVYDCMLARHGNMLVGRTGSGKTVSWKALQCAQGRLKDQGVEGFEHVYVHIINPLALSNDEIYGSFNRLTNEWTDGVLSNITRKVCSDESPDKKWILFDGPVDTLWIESMNSLLDDNKILTLLNGERISMPSQVSLLFEVEDLSQASPATVSRAGMIYLNVEDLKWWPYAESWLQRKAAAGSDQTFIRTVRVLLDKYVDKATAFQKKNCKELVPTDNLSCLITLCTLFDALATTENGVSPQEGDSYIPMIENWFLFVLIWSIGASLDEEGRAKFDIFLREMDPRYPAAGIVYDYYIDTKKKSFVPWEEKLSGSYKVPVGVPFFRIHVPTVDTVRTSYILKMLILANKHAMVVGRVGVGKTLVVESIVHTLPEGLSTMTINFSAQTSSNSLQVNFTTPNDNQMKRIFGAILTAKLANFEDEPRLLGDALVTACVEVYNAITSELLPIPGKGHYVFNMRDLSKVIQGLLQATKEHYISKDMMLQLLCHECFRVYADRMWDVNDKVWLQEFLDQKLKDLFNTEWKSLFRDGELSVFTSCMQPGTEGVYEPIPSFKELKDALEENLKELQSQPGVLSMDLVLFRDAMEHVCRIHRVLIQPRGNLLLVGVGGSGRKSLTRLAAFVADMKVFTVNVTKNYGPGQFHDDLKALYQQAGIGENRPPVVFLFDDTQIVVETFLEDINNIMSTGEVPNLFTKDDLQSIFDQCRAAAKKANAGETDDELYSFFLEKARENLHVVLCLSPVQESFHRRLQMFPGLVNCTTIDWFLDWPQDALHEVAVKLMAEEKTLATSELKSKICKIFVTIHKSVSTMSSKMLAQLRRHNYVTPTSYLDFAKGYRKLLTEKKQQLEDSASKLKGGLNTLNETREQVAKMQVVDSVLKKINKFTTDPEFTPEAVGKVSGAARGLCLWVRAMEAYGYINKEVAPKKAKLKAAQDTLQKKEAALQEARNKLEEVRKKVQTLKDKYDRSLASKEALQKESDDLELKLQRAEKLILGLAGEKSRWEVSITTFQEEIKHLPGDCLVAAACLSYAGPFASEYREDLIKGIWVPEVLKAEIPSSPGFGFSTFLANAGDVRDWNLQGLPADSFSTENGVLVTRSNRWPLMIDPQEQAKKWVKNMEANNDLVVVDLQTEGLMRKMEDCIQLGTPVLLVDVLEQIDPSLDPVLAKAFITRGSRVTMGKKTQAACEDQILRLLATAEGPLLDNLDLINTLDVSKETYETVKQSLEVAEVTAKSIEVASAAYKSCAERASLLYFILNELVPIDPMYQFSLEAYMELFLISIMRSAKSDNLTERIKSLIDYHTYAVYKYTSRGLFEKHKLLMSLLICSKILLTSNVITNDEWQFFLRGGSVLDRSKQPANPAPEWISESSWDDVTELATSLPTHFEGIVGSLQQETGRWGTWLRTSEPENVELPGDWEDRCNELQHLILLRCFRQDRLMSATAAYVANVLGQKFVEPPMLDLAESFDDSSPSSPLLFILSAGVDPTTSLQQFAASKGLSDRFHAVALGQGQGPVAIKLINESARTGGWVFLANCHLMTSWLPQLEKVIQELEKSNPHEMFRLWLSSEPNDKFPISILQRSVKMTAEPPKGMRANVLRLYTQTTDESFQKCKTQSKYQKLFFSLAYFHSVLLERRKFGTLGLNIPYDFNDTDFQVSNDILKTYLDAYEETPFEALKFLISEANYGGRVTDEIDRRVLSSYLNQFYCQEALTVPNFPLSSIALYHIPDDGTLQTHKEFIQTWPTVDRPEAFGQHTNADIASQLSASKLMLTTIASLQPKETSSKGGMSQEEKVMNIVTDLLQQVPEPFDLPDIQSQKSGDASALHTVLFQEIERYNILLKHIRESCMSLQKGLQGLVVMSLELETMYKALSEGKVPARWIKSYPTLKPLGSWTRDLLQRLGELKAWADGTYPNVYWLGGFTYPADFLTAVMQTTARRSLVPIDTLSWEFSIVNRDEADINEPAKDGIFVKGLFLEGAGWDKDNECLKEPQPMELIVPMPIMHFKPMVSKKKPTKGIYMCPLYLYPIRTGSRERPSFLLYVTLKSGTVSPDHWVKRGTALLLALAN
ncbi:hypothetical protein GOP47_0027599 [Adiantum capillus-veneris]|nr:hypothetical protein GOP47_0027599 [Adiantum capillus-veneris]